MKISKKLLVTAIAALFATPLFAQSVTDLYSFAGIGNLTNSLGQSPEADLVLSGNTFYGTTPFGGTNAFGTVFSIDTAGSNFSVLHNFGDHDGASVGKDLVLREGVLYGTVGENTNIPDFGAVFCVATNGSNFSLVFPFTSSSQGEYPKGKLAICSDTIYGTTSEGGNNAGTVFSVTTNGDNFTVLHTFDRNAEGFMGLGGVIVADGTIYGTLRDGGPGSFGSVFSIPTNGGTLTILHSFSGKTNEDGEFPDAALTLMGNTLYGTTFAGGDTGTVFSVETNADDYTILHTFTNGLGDGASVEGGLAISGNTLYGTTYTGGTNAGSGTVFSVNTDGGSFTVLYTFSTIENSTSNANFDGARSFSTPVLVGDILYGTTSAGGTNGFGVVFGLPILPKIKATSVSGSNLTMTAINGRQGHAYTLLSSGNLTVPVSAWTALATNVLTSGGNFIITATNGLNSRVSQQFYSLQTQ